MRASDTLREADSRKGYPLLVIEGRSANFGLPAEAVVRVMDRLPLEGEPPLDLSEALDLDSTRAPARVLEIRVDGDVFPLKTFGPVLLRIAMETEVLPLPQMVRRISPAAFIDRLALVDGVAGIWVLDPWSLLRQVCRLRQLRTRAGVERDHRSIRGDT